MHGVAGKLIEGVENACWRAMRPPAAGSTTADTCELYIKCEPDPQD